MCQVCVAALYASTELRHSEAAVGLMPPSRYSVWLCRYTGRVSVYTPAAETGVLHHPLSHTRCSNAKVTAVWTARRFRGCRDLDHLGSCAGRMEQVTEQRAHAPDVVAQTADQQAQNDQESSSHYQQDSSAAASDASARPFIGLHKDAQEPCTGKLTIGLLPYPPAG